MAYLRLMPDLPDFRAEPSVTPEGDAKAVARYTAWAEANLDPADLREFTQRALRSSKTPDRFWLLEELPRTETGKLLRRLVPGLIRPAQ